MVNTILHLEDPPAPHLPQESDHVGVSGPGQRQQPVAPGEVSPAKGLAPVEREGPRHEEEEGPAGQEHDRAHGGLVWSFGKDSSMKESTSGGEAAKKAWNKGEKNSSIEHTFFGI